MNNISMRNPRLKKSTKILFRNMQLEPKGKFIAMFYLREKRARTEKKVRYKIRKKLTFGFITSVQVLTTNDARFFRL